MKALNTFEIVRLIGETPKGLFNFIETSILTRMAFIGNKEGKNINPGINELVSQTKLSRRPLIRAINSLVKKNALILCCNRPKGSWGKSCYDINVSLLQEARESKNTSETSYHSKLKIEKKPVSRDKKLSTSSVSETPLYKNEVVSLRHGGGVGETPRRGVGETPLPYIQLLEPIYPPNEYVELALDAPVFSSTKIPNKISKKEKNWSVESLDIFEHWKKIMDHPKAKFDEARKRKIKKALGELGFTVEELKKAIDGAKKSSWHQRGNPDGVLYDSIDLIFRNPEKIETFINIFDTQGAVKNKNVATGLKTSFTERNKSMVNMMAEIGAEMFPEYADTFIANMQEGILLTSREEMEVNGHG